MNTYNIYYTNLLTRRTGMKKIKALSEQKAKIVFESRYDSYLIDSIELGSSRKSKSGN